jgi:hypothetical protein
VPLAVSSQPHRQGPKRPRHCAALATSWAAWGRVGWFSTTTPRCLALSSVSMVASSTTSCQRFALPHTRQNAPLSQALLLCPVRYDGSTSDVRGKGRQVLTLLCCCVPLTIRGRVWPHAGDIDAGCVRLHVGPAQVSRLVRVEDRYLCRECPLPVVCHIPQHRARERCGCVGDVQGPLAA